MGKNVKLYEEYFKNKDLSEFKDELKIYFDDKYDDIIEIIDSIKNEKDVKEALEKISFLIDGEEVANIESDKINDNYWKNVAALYIEFGDIHTMTIIYETVNKKFVLNSSSDWMDEHVELFTDN
jgi:hypothetical protein